ncbi:MAG: hypothetical protein ACMUIM_03660 [bacterium]
MKMITCKQIIFIFFAILFVLLSSIRMVSAEFIIIEHEGMDFDDIGVSAVNNQGEVAGTATKFIPDSYEPMEVCAFIWSKDEGFRLLSMDTDEKIWTWANDINENGDIVGDMAKVTQDGEYESFSGFLYTEDSGMIDLKSLLGGDFSGATGINDQGQITGWRSTEMGGTAFILEDGIVRDLGSLGSGGYNEFSGANAINNPGHIVGSSMTNLFEEHAFKWMEDTEMMDLGTLPDRTESCAEDINDRNEVVGYSYRYEYFEGDYYAVDLYGFLWNEEEDMIDLGALPGCNSSQPTAINNNGDIAGISMYVDDLGFPVLDEYDFPVRWAAFIYSEDHGMVDFGEMIGVPNIFWVTDINDHGQVIGMGTDPDSGPFFYSFIWTPEIEAREVRIDIRPRSQINWINKYGFGLIPVAVFGDSDVNVRDIDLESLRLQEVLKIKTLCFTDIPLVWFMDLDRDGHKDLIAFFSNGRVFSDGDTSATLTGNLNDGTLIKGTDTILIVP